MWRKSFEIFLKLLPAKLYVFTPEPGILILFHSLILNQAAPAVGPVKPADKSAKRDSRAKVSRVNVELFYLFLIQWLPLKPS